MIEYMFVINFNELIIYEGPAVKKHEFSEFVKLSKIRCLSNFKEHDSRYKETITLKKKSFELMAKINEDSIIVGFLVAKDFHDEDKAWKAIDAVFSLISKIDIENDNFDKITQDLDHIYYDFNCHHSNNKSAVFVNGNSNIVNCKKSTNQELEESRDKMSGISDLLELKVNEKLIEHDRHDEYAYWDTKKGMIIVGCGIALVFGVFMAFLNIKSSNN